MKNIIIFDLDETCINSEHRTPNNPDGTLNLPAYIELHSADNVAKDTLLPISRIMRDRYNMGDYIIILTARDMAEWDYKYLDIHDLLEIFLYLTNDNLKNDSYYSLKDLTAHTIFQ